MDTNETGATSHKLVGGRLCLDFANTVDWHASDHPGESLNGYEDLVEWSCQAGILTPSQAKRLDRLAAQDPPEATAVLERARAIREAIYELFSAAAQGRPPVEHDLEVLNEALSEVMARRHIVPTKDGFEWGWTEGEDRLDEMVWPVVQSAVELLTSPELGRVGQCADERGCGWLFFDTSRNHSRRWCDIKDCGNRAKARRHYLKTKS